MKRRTFALLLPAAASAAAFCVLRVPTRVDARRAALRLVTREASLGRVQAGELKGTRTVSPDRRRVEVEIVP